MLFSLWHISRLERVKLMHISRMVNSVPLDRVQLLQIGVHGQLKVAFQGDKVKTVHKLWNMKICDANSTTNT